MSRPTDRRRAMRSALALLTLLASGCGQEPAETRATASPEESAPAAEMQEPEGAEVALPPATPGQRRMHDRYDTVDVMRAAFVDGDQTRASALATQLGPVSADALPEAARDLRDVIPDRARAVVEASDLEAAALAYADLVLACGSCHRAAGATWSWDDPEIPAGDDLAQRMARHRHAVDRMWEALLVGDESRFDAAAQLLRDAPLTGETPPEDEVPPGLSALAEHVRTLAGRASEAEHMPARAALFGELLGTCASCHQRIEALDTQGS